MDVFQRLVNSLRNQGLSATVFKLYPWILEQLYDVWTGTNTRGNAEITGLSIDSDNKGRGTRYEPTRVYSLRKLFEAMRSIIPPGRSLVDFGCGKGRVLLVAAEFGFKRATGVEFAHELCDIARGNISTYMSRNKSGIQLEIVEGDAADYEINNSDDVFFMFNPFDAFVLEKVLDNITSSLQIRNRKVWIIYHNPKHHDIFERDVNFSKIRDLKILSNEFSVYSNQA